MYLFYKKEKRKTEKHKKFYMNYIRVGRYALSMTNKTTWIMGSIPGPIVPRVVAIATTITQTKIYHTYVKNLSLSQ